MNDADRNGILERKLKVTEVKVTYCGYCKEQTAHQIIKHVGGQTLNCVRCGCDRLDTIQGFDASLM